MKLKEFGRPGGGVRPKFYYVDPPMPIGNENGTSFCDHIQKKEN